MQDFGDCIQSSQTGPQRVQPLSANPIAITPPSNTNLRTMHAPTPLTKDDWAPKLGHFHAGHGVCNAAQARRNAAPRNAARARRSAAAARRFDRAAAQITLRNKAEKESTT
ncbi:hypothetical protein [Bradyrhizobium sp. USDA 4454]